MVDSPDHHEGEERRTALVKSAVPEKRVDGPEKVEKLPWGLPRRPPDLAGTLIHMDSKEEIADYPSITAAILELFIDLIWIIPNVPRNKETERIVMTTLRIRTGDGEVHDARLRGTLRKAYIAMGDSVSLWGHERKGVLFINRGYNHTSKAIISTQSLDALLPALIVLAAFVILVPLLPRISHYIP